jgi:flavin-dependent dehydrogenase
VPSGLGWALVGDAGLRMDPITGQGIADAFRDAELLADAVAGEIS